MRESYFTIKISLSFSFCLLVVFELIALILVDLASLEIWSVDLLRVDY